MKNAAYILIFGSIASGILFRLLRPTEEWLFASAGLALLVGGIILLADGIARILRRELILRPFDAIKKASWLFLIIFGLQILLRYLVSSQKLDATAALIQSAAFAVVFGFHSTAYRRRV